MPAAYEKSDALGVFGVLGITEVKQLSAVGAIPGTFVTRAAARNGEGTGRIRSTGDGTELSWKEPGSSTWGAPTQVGGDGDYLLLGGDDPDSWVRVTVDASYLSTNAEEARVLMSDVYLNGITIGNDVSAAEASAGATNQWQVTLKNQGGVVLESLVCWIDAAVSDLEISDGPSGPWVSPTTEATALAFPNLSPGSTDLLYVKQTTGASEPSSIKRLNHLHFSFWGL